MKRLIALPLFLLSLMVFGKSYYIKNAGNDLLAGTSDSDAWESISKVNSFSFSPGDFIFFKRGDKFIGTLTPSSSGTSSSYITYGAYGTGAMPIITPNDYITGLTWTVYSGSIYKTTGIPFNPGNMLINGVTKINKINDSWFSSASSSAYGNLKALQILALSSGYTVNFCSTNVSFWDVWGALYCYDISTGTTYIRFKDGDDPNTKNLAVSVKEGYAVYIDAKRYITIENLNIIGGETGIRMNAVSYTGTDNIIIDGCKVESSNKKIYCKNSSNGVIVRNCTVTNNYLGTYGPGAFEYSTGYIYGERNQWYEFGKYVIGASDSSEIDQGIQLDGDNNKAYNNTITNCVNGISTGIGSNKESYNNYISGCSSIAIHFGTGTLNCSAYNNTIVNANIGFRFQYCDDPLYPTRTDYIYRNTFYSPDGGYFMYQHLGTNGPSLTKIYFYHNSIICKTGITISSYILDHPEASGCIFVNNILSSSWYNSYPYTGIATKANLFKFYYNWVGGTYYGAGSLSGDISLWATDASNQNHVGTTFWNHSIDPPDFTNIEGRDVIDAGIDVSKPFTLGGVNYSALPGISSTDYNGNPDIGVFEYSDTNSNRKLVTSITVTGAGGATTIITSKGTLQLSAAVLPSDATNKTVTWSVANGTGQASISSSGLLTAIDNGTVTVRATANDGSGVFGTLVITISNQTISVTNISVTGAGGATTVTAGATLQLSAAVSPSNASNKTVTWSITNGTGQAVINSSGLVTANASGTVTARATANDGSGVYGTLLITIANQIIFVTGITVIAAGGITTITIDKGTLQLSVAVSPSDATNKTVTWSISNDTGQATISSSGLVTAVSNGTVTARATANDGSGVYGTLVITVSVPVTNQPPVITISNPTSGSTFTAPATITVTASASDADGTISKVEFFNGATILGEKTSNPWSFTWNNVPVGTYSLTVVATDNSGAKTTSSAVSITVASSTPPENQPPVITISNPVTGSTFTAPAIITITANASDSDGTISKVEFFNGAVKLGEKTSNPWSFTWNNVPVGTYSLTAVATDNSDAKTTSSAVSITVNNLPPVTNQPPIVTISNPIKGRKYKKPAKITIDAVASDPDGTISKIEFFNGSIELAELTTAPWSYEWKDVDVGTYSITAIATDNLNATTVSSPVDVEVEDDIITSFYDVNSEIIILYPNPNNGIFTIELIDPLQSEKSEIAITSFEGKVIYNGTMLQEELTKQFDLSYIKPGFYILILSRNEIVVTKKFIKK